jgi:Co/Zn/Cd efflux system component
MLKVGGLGSIGIPRAEIMRAIGILALAANLASVLILMRYKDGDANVRSVWLCSRKMPSGISRS